MDDTEALGMFDHLLSRLDSATPVVHPACCAVLRHRGSQCRLCLDACPTSAIGLGDLLEVDPDRCLGCGLCANVCPNGALTMKRGDIQIVREVETALACSDEAAFACPHYRGVDRGLQAIRVPCLGALSEAVLASAVFGGARAVHLVDAPCSKCPLPGGHQLAARTVAATDSILSPFGLGGRIFFSQRPPSRQAAAGAALQGHSGSRSRRQFLELLGREGVAAVATLFLQGEAPAEPRARLAERALPAKRLVLLDALRSLPAPAAFSTAGPDLPFAELEISGHCTGCGMCALFCPTAALTKVEQADGTVDVLFRSDRCTNCHLCVDICYKRAISLEPRLELEKVLEGHSDVLWNGRPTKPEERLRRWTWTDILGEQDSAGR